MNIKKTVTAKVVAANRENAKKSTGPKTIRGKGHSRIRALKHGLFSATPIVRQEDRPKFEAIRMAITHQLAPATTLQEIACEHVVYCYWRVPVAMRLEIKGTEPLLVEDQNTVDNASSEEALPSRPYLASSTDRRNALRFLSQLRQIVADSGSLHLETHRDTMIRVFGNQFYDALNNWAPHNVDAIRCAYHLTRHAEIFKKPLPEKLMSGERIVPDPKQSWEMALKLIDEKMQHLQDLGRISQQSPDGPDQQHTALDNVSRYVRSVMRDLERAISFYLYLKEMGL